MDVPRSAREAGDDGELPRFALSSEIEVERQGFFGDRWIEILDHSPASVRTERLQDNLPMYVSHRGDQVGAWRQAAVERDGMIRADPVFSRNPRGQEIERDVRDGIRTKTSIGYRIWDAKLEEVRVDDETEEEIRVFRITDWEPLEGSIAGIPADHTVGAGRSATGAAPVPEIKSPEPASQAKERTVENEPTTTAQDGAGGDQEREGNGGVGTVEPGVDHGAQERQRVSEVLTLGREHNVPQETVDRWLKEGARVSRVKDEILRLQVERGEIDTSPPDPVDPLGLSEEERRSYSIRNAILQQVPRSEGGIEQGFEAEVSEAMERHLPNEYERKGGILVPTSALVNARTPTGRMQRDGLDTGTATKGQEAVFEEFAGFLEMLRTRAMVMALGADFLPGLQGTVSFVKQTGAASATWEAENDDADVATSEMTLTKVTLSPKTLMGNTFFSRQLLRQNVINVDQRVENDLTQVHARAIDLASLHGATGGNDPEGIYNATGVNSVAFGGSVSFAKIVDMETEVAADDADIGVMAYLTTPEVRGAAKKTEEFSGSNGRPIWTGSVREGEMNGFRAAASNQLEKTLGAGLDEHGLIFGVWNELLLGEWGMLELIADPFSRKKEGLIEVTSFQMVDIQLAYAEAFCKATGLIP